MILELTNKAYCLIKEKILFLYEKLQLPKQEKEKGRKLKISIPNIITLGLFKQRENIATKKALYEIVEPPCSYKTLVVNLNRFAPLVGIILAQLLKWNQKDSHRIKHTDATDIPVCANRKARNHKTMDMLADWGKTGKGWFYGLKLHLTTDFNRKPLSIVFSSGNVNDRSVFLKLNKNLDGIFVADSGYLSEKLQQEFYQKNRRILFVKPRANMKKIATAFQTWLYGTRMMIELNFRILKQFYGLVTSLPKSINGFLSHYLYSLLAYVIA